MTDEYTQYHADALARLDESLRRIEQRTGRPRSGWELTETRGETVSLRQQRERLLAAHAALQGAPAAWAPDLIEGARRLAQAFAAALAAPEGDAAVVKAAAALAEGWEALVADCPRGGQRAAESAVPPTRGGNEILGRWSGPAGEDGEGGKDGAAPTQGGNEIVGRWPR